MFWQIWAELFDGFFKFIGNIFRGIFDSFN